ncbi:MAG TPA: hypothetical protein VLR92_12415 [Blastocatellia bacterium]|nr:hypothetical protein [Blastocatellia bacterium]
MLFSKTCHTASFFITWSKVIRRLDWLLDRAAADGSPHNEQQQNIASIAATGFGLTALCIIA